MVYCKIREQITLNWQCIIVNWLHSECCSVFNWNKHIYCVCCFVWYVMEKDKSDANLSVTQNASKWAFVFKNHTFWCGIQGLHIWVNCYINSELFSWNKLLSNCYFSYKVEHIVHLVDIRHIIIIIKL